MNSGGRTFADAVRYARQLSSEPDVFALRADYARECVAYIDEQTERILDPLRPSFLDEPFKVVSIESVRQTIIASSGLREIRVYEVESPVGFRSIYGYVEIMGDVASIVCDAGLNFCWRRFTILKELMHIYSRTVADGDECWRDGARYAGSLIRNAVDSRCVAVKKPDQILEDEAFAFYVALEVMLPWSLRNQLARLRKLSAGNYQIAKAFFMPKRFIDFFLDEDDDFSSYMRLSEDVNTAIRL